MADRNKSNDDALRLRLDEADEDQTVARIKVIGVGGGGSNAVNRMVQARVDGVEFIVANTDKQALRVSPAATKIQIGGKLTKGLGAGADPNVGRQAALRRHRRDHSGARRRGRDLVTGLGSGTGTGARRLSRASPANSGALRSPRRTAPFVQEEASDAGQRGLSAEGLVDTINPIVTGACGDHDRNTL
jgi:cell division protein FtsZ